MDPGGMMLYLFVDQPGANLWTNATTTLPLPQCKVQTNTTVQGGGWSNINNA